LATVKAHYDRLLRWKVSYVQYRFYYKWTRKAAPESSALVREGIEYGKERGIGALMYAEMPFVCLVADHPDVKRTCLPAGRYGEFVRCWSMDDLRRQTADSLASMVAAMGITDIGFHDLPAFEDVVAARLLHVHVFARLTGPDGQQRVPMVGRDNGNGVKRLVVQHAAEVLDALGRVAGQFPHDGASSGEQAAVGIDEVGDLHIAHLRVRSHMRLSSTVDAGHGHAHPIIGTQHAARCLRARDGRLGSDATLRGTSQKIAAIVAKHGLSPCVAIDS
jgi:hypothetical protein